MSTPFATAPSKIDKPATFTSCGYLRDLMLDKAAHLAPDVADAEARVAEWFTRPRSQALVSEHIGRLKAEGYTGRKFRGQQAAVDETRPGPDVVPDGYYALDSLDGATNSITFYKVDRPIDGRWAGYVFVKREEGPNERNVPREQVTSILLRIARVGAREASLRYGKEIGRCGVCHLQLTNDESREAGIGPICRSKLDW